MSLWKGVNSDFSEIDTSGTDVSLGALASCDLADIIVEENALTNTDYINNNFEEEREKNDNNNGTTWEFKHPSVPSADRTTTDDATRAGKVQDESENSVSSERSISDKEPRERRRRYPCIVCKKKFAEKATMKTHVKSTHLRHVVLCNVCGKRMFQDKFAKHQQVFHSQSF